MDLEFSSLEIPHDLDKILSQRLCELFTFTTMIHQKGGRPTQFDVSY